MLQSDIKSKLNLQHQSLLIETIVRQIFYVKQLDFHGRLLENSSNKFK